MGDGKIWIQKIDREDQLHICPKCFSIDHDGLECDVSTTILKNEAYMQHPNMDELQTESPEVIVPAPEKVESRDTKQDEPNIPLIEAIPIDIESQIAALTRSNRMEGQLAIKDKIKSSQENSIVDPQNKDEEITVLGEGEIDSSASEWEEDFSPEASIIMDSTVKGLEKTTSSMKEPNIKTKGKRGRKSRKTLLKIAVIGENRDLWNLLFDKLQSTNVENCKLARDFNAILVESEKKGGIQRLGTSQKDFQNRILEITRTDGSTANNSKEIAQEALEYFENLMNGVAQTDQEVRDRILNSIPPLINENQNKALFREIIVEEVKKATFQLNPDKTLGPDGFSAAFSQKFGDIIEQDLFRAVEESRRKMTMLGEINHTFLALIPKKKNPEIMSDFRPISLYNTVYKIVTKVIANRPKLFLNHVISDEQSGFASGRSVVEGIIIAHETLHTARKTKNSCMILKLDILKAYDMVDRKFLTDVLRKFGFCKEWIA
ncbi:uncharacterized protein LOC131875241 [Cryptomeria japonica]|uniref:uncharacterized protein LOC131875241 n=1 Tax=Cryptomeria japonica TaxID=3369 RepID=UPI0027DAA773|nr:uncharacterized protein LOC131875241 [Cryptomeria japonica]